MNGPHDLGGAEGFGAIPFDPDEETFRHDWERKVFGLTMAASTIGLFNRDENRHARERIAPGVYRDTGYFEQWLIAIEANLIELGVLDRDTLCARIEEFRADPGRDVRGAPQEELFLLFQDTVEFGASLERTVERAPAYAAGDRVQAIADPAAGHTRLPGYVRGHVGVVRRVDPAFVLPDRNAHHEGEAPEFTYSVAFEATQLWGRGDHQVIVDVWESYLRPA